MKGAYKFSLTTYGNMSKVENIFHTKTVLHSWLIEDLQKSCMVNLQGFGISRDFFVFETLIRILAYPEFL